MERWRGKTALVTGASSGIGLATAETLAKQGVNVIGCARNIQKIEELAKALSGGKNGTVTAIKCDLNSEDDILKMFSDIEKNHQGLDILVNNAGLAFAEPLASGNTAKWREMIDVNVIALSICARETLRLMDKNKVTAGHIINVNSMGGHALPPVADFHMYSGTKHMVTLLSKALYREVNAKGSKIRVTNLSPGAVDTDFSNRVQAEKPAGENKYSEAELASFRFKFLSSQDLADAIIYILGAPQHVCVKELILAPTEQPAAMM